ncbi:MAG: iron-containing redox enzyme family protein [Actinomycetota bacterium]
MSKSVLVHDLDAAVAARSLLQHPFYRAWTAGTLTRDDLGFYATQYWRQVEAFPTYLEALVERFDEPTGRDIVEANLRDEVEDDHAGLWIEFARALGVEEADLRGTTEEPETTGCVDAFRRGTRDGSVPYALGMLYGYESQTPAVAATKIQGLRDHYGIDGSATRYFELHGQLDVEHSAGLARAIESVATDDDAEVQARAGAEAGAGSVWTLLDGVARVRAI